MHPQGLATGFKPMGKGDCKRAERTGDESPILTRDPEQNQLVPPGLVSASSAEGSEHEHIIVESRRLGLPP
jgi:hypothetical protein